MTRVKRGVNALKRRRKILKYAKGYQWGRKSKERAAHDALMHAWTHAFQHRKKKKGEFRAVWNTRISAALSDQGLSYSKFIGALVKKEIGLNRKVLSEIAAAHPKIFEAIVKEVTLKG